MSGGLPLEVIGLISPVLYWVEGGESPGLPDSWRGENFSFLDRIKSWLMRELPTYSYDSLDEIIKLSLGDKCFRQVNRRYEKQHSIMAPLENVDLVHIFRKLSRHYFDWRGNALCVREGRMVELHELAMRFPIRYLIRYSHAEAVVRGYITMGRARELPSRMSRLHTTYQNLRTVVERGLYEGHLHLNGVINADEAWADQLLKRVSPGAQEGFSTEAGRLLALSRTAVRLLAVGMLYAQIDKGDRKNLPFHLIHRLDRMYQAGDWLENRGFRQELNHQFIREFESETKLGKIAWGKKRDLHWLLALANPGMNATWFMGDTRARWDETVQPRGVRHRIDLLKRLHLEVQTFLVRNSIDADAEPENQDRGRQVQRENGENTGGVPHEALRNFINQVFIRYVIYHTHHWQEATQSGKTTGLKKFQRYFDSPQRGLFSDERAEMEGLAIEDLSHSGALRAVEGRLSPPTKGSDKFIPWILALAKQVKEGELEKFGIVVHFTKKEYSPFEKKTRRGYYLYSRYGKIRRKTQVDAFKLFRLLSSPNPVTPFIIGIDAASLELSTPPEVFAPAFRFLREYPIELRSPSTTREACGKYKEISSLMKNRRLGLTFHVGEEFRHLLSGLRAIHEVIEFLKPIPGDRLGHAIALGLDPGVWTSQVGNQAVMPRQEWLDNLVWVHHLLGPGHNLIGELEVEDLIQRYSRKIYHKSILKNMGGEGTQELDLTPPTLYDAWRLRQLDPYSVDRTQPFDNKFLILPHGHSLEHKRWAEVQNRALEEVDQYVGTNSAYRIVKHHWYNYKVREIGDRIITVDMKENKPLWIKICHEVQEKLREIVRKRQMVVEVNPSSNWIIGPMAHMDEHPVFRITLDKEKRLSKESRVTINSDDPGVFFTSLHHEFYLLGGVLLNQEVPEARVMEWLEWLRKNGIDYSFLRSLPDFKDQRVKKILDYLFKRYEPLLHRVSGDRRKYKPPKSRIKSNEELEQENKRLKTSYKQMEARLESLERKLQDRD